MRWLMVGPYAPERQPGAAATTAAARERIDAGDEVTVVSPRPSAGHEHRDLAGLDALRWLFRSVTAGTGLWVRIEPGILLTRDAPRGVALAERALLSLILRRAAHSVLDVGDPGLFPGGRAGRFIFGPVDQLVVHTVEHETLLLRAGARPASVVLAPTAPTGTVPRSATLVERPAAARPELPAADFSDLLPGSTRDEIEQRVRARVAEVALSVEGRE